MVHIPAAAENCPGIERSVLVQVQPVFRDKLPQVAAAEILLLFPESVLKVKSVHGKLVRRDHHHVIRNLPGHPVMAADGFHPPDLVLIVESDAVGFISAVFLQQLRQAQHAFPSTADIRQHQHQEILLTDAAGNILFLSCFCLPVPDHRIRRQHPGIGGNGFRGRHAHSGLIDARRRPDAVLRIHVRTGRIAHGRIRQFHLCVGNDALILFRLILRIHNDQLLDIKMTVIRPGNHGGSVMAGFRTNQYCCAGHVCSSFLFPYDLSVVLGTVPNHSRKVRAPATAHPASRSVH